MCADLKRLKSSLGSWRTWMCILDFSILRCSADFGPRQTGRRKIYIWPNFQQSASEILINYQTLNSGPSWSHPSETEGSWVHFGSSIVLSFSSFPDRKPDIHTQSQQLTFSERSDDISKDQVQFFFHKVQELYPDACRYLNLTGIDHLFTIYLHNPDHCIPPLFYIHIQ